MKYNNHSGNLLHHASDHLNDYIDNPYRYDDSILKLKYEINIQEIALEMQNERLLQLNSQNEHLAKKYNELCHVLPIGIFTLDQNGLIIEMNPYAARILGVNHQAVISKSFSRYVAPESQLQFASHRHQAMKSDELKSCDIKLICKNGPLIHAHVYSKAVPGANIGQNNLLVLIGDAHALHQDEKTDPRTPAHQDVHRMNTFVELVSNIASEINHPLCIINNYLYGCMRRLEDKTLDHAALKKVMSQITKQSQRAADIIVRMKNFNCHEKLVIESININSLLRDIMTLLKHESVDYPVEIICRTINEDIYVEADRTYIEYILLNLSRNALEAMRDANTPDAKLIIEANHTGEKTVEIAIMDNGPGIPAENLPRLFDCHFTTKPYGTGMGLAMIRSMIEAHHGQLCIESLQTGGTLFKFSLAANCI